MCLDFGYIRLLYLLFKFWTTELHMLTPWALSTSEGRHSSSCYSVYYVARVTDQLHCTLDWFAQSKHLLWIVKLVYCSGQACADLVR